MWYNSGSSHASAVQVLKSMYPVSTPDCSDDGLSSNDSSTEKEQTEGITNCDMKSDYSSWETAKAGLSLVTNTIIHDHAGNQAQHATAMRYLE